MDVTKSQQVDALADAVVKDYGHVDILVANAGIARSQERPPKTLRMSIGLPSMT